jgi:Protein of unknown function (DUF3071)
MVREATHMEDLRLVGLSEDGSRLVIESSGGDRYALPIDERVFAALRGDRSRLGQLQITIESQLRPRDIQARIRAGQTAEQVAVAAGVPVERVRRFEGPILAERTHVAELAQGVGVRRVTDAVTTPLGTVVAGRLDGLGVDTTALEWDSWKRDSRWVVQLVYIAGEHARTATWLFDPSRRILEPADDEARWITDEERSVPSAVSTPPRLAAVPAAPEPVRRIEPVPELDDAPDDADDAAGVEEDNAAVDMDDTEAGRDFYADDAGRGDLSEDDEREVADAAERAGRASRSGKRIAATPAPRARGRRAVVPSWDEILFGTGSPPPGPDRER